MLKNHVGVMFAILATAATFAAVETPQLDGEIAPQEWANAAQEKLVGGGELLLLNRDNALYIAVKGPARGLASLCLGNRDHVSILHASAALGTAQYQRNSQSWSRQEEFDWQVRDSPDAARILPSERAAFLEKHGWLANSSRPGAPVREFVIKLSPDHQFLGVTFLAVDTLAVTYWPPTMTDDCRAVDVLRGDPPQVVRLQPETWHPVSR